MFEKYQRFVESYLRGQGRQNQSYRMSLVDYHLVVTTGEGYNTVITFFRLDELESLLYLYQEPEVGPVNRVPAKMESGIRNVTEVVKRKYQLEDVE